MLKVIIIYASELELCTQTPSNAWMHNNCFRFKKYKAIVYDENSDKNKCETPTKNRIEWNIYSILYVITDLQQ